MWLLFVSCKELQKNHGAHLKYLLVWTGSYCLEGLLWGKSFSHNYHTIGWYTYSADAVHPIHLAFSVSVPVIAHKESYCHGLVPDTLAKKRTYTCLFSYAHSIKYFTGATASSETQGQIVGTRESLNGWKNMARRKVKNGEKSPFGSLNSTCLTHLWISPTLFIFLDKVTLEFLAKLSSDSNLHNLTANNRMPVFENKRLNLQDIWRWILKECYL